MGNSKADSKGKAATSVMAQISSSGTTGDGDDDGAGCVSEEAASAMGRISPILEAQRNPLPRRKYKGGS